MFDGRTEILTVESMYGEGAALFGCFMKYDFVAGECQWSSVEIEVSEEAGVCRDIRLTSGR